MNFIDAYIEAVDVYFKNFRIPNRDSKMAVALYELGDSIDSVIPSQIKLQDKCLSIGVLTSSAILNNKNLLKGVYTGKLANDLNIGLTQEVSIWTSIWSASKAAAISTGTSSGAYPPAFSFPGIPSNGSILSNYLISTTPKNAPGIQSLAKAFEIYLTELYKKYIMSGPPPTYELI